MSAHTLNFKDLVVHKDEPRYVGRIVAMNNGDVNVEWAYGPAYASWHPRDQITHDLEICRDYLNRKDAEHPDGFCGPIGGGDRITWNLRCALVRNDLGNFHGNERIAQLEKAAWGNEMETTR